MKVLSFLSLTMLAAINKQAPPSITHNKATNDNIISWFTQKGKATKLQLLKAYGQSSGLISNRCTKKKEVISGKLRENMEERLAGRE